MSGFSLKFKEFINLIISLLNLHTQRWSWNRSFCVLKSNCCEPSYNQNDKKSNLL